MPRGSTNRKRSSPSCDRSMFWPRTITVVPKSVTKTICSPLGNFTARPRRYRGGGGPFSSTDRAVLQRFTHGTSLDPRIVGSPADCRPRHAIDPGQPDILQPCRIHECCHLIASPIMRYVREHLVEDDRAQMSEAESCCKPEVFRGSKFELQQDP